VASATPLDGGAGPSPESGFGIPALAKALPVDGEFGLRVADARLIGPTERHAYALRVVLAYADRGLSPEHEMPLWADLDLVVVAPSGRVFTGNALPGNETEQFNTLERVIVDAVESGVYKLIVLSSAFPVGTVRELAYALVATGPFDHSDFAANPPEFPFDAGGECAVPCGDGQCVGGRCACPAGKFGIACEREYERMPMQTTRTFPLVPGTATWIAVPVPFYNRGDPPVITAELDDPWYIGLLGVCWSNEPFPTYAGEPSYCQFPTAYEPTYLSFSFAPSGVPGAVVYASVYVIGYEPVDVTFRVAVKTYPNDNAPTQAVGGDLATAGGVTMLELIGGAIVCGVALLGIGTMFGALFLGGRREGATQEALVTV
jgi:hypothetical protein